MDGDMIIRVFRGVVQPGMQDDFERLIRDRAIPEFRAHPGLVTLQFGTPREQNPDEFLVVTVWRSLDDLRAFAGDGFLRAKVSKGERRFLRDAFVHHYEEASPALPPLDRVRGRAPAPVRTPRPGILALLAAGPSLDVDGVTEALRDRGLRPLSVGSGEAAARLLAR